jgi:TerC family integral membrane protein
MKGALRWIAFYLSLALAFGAALLVVLGATPSGEFLAGYVTEYSLSADNLFVLMMIIARFGVPEVAVDRVLYVGIVLSLILRGLFIAAGAAAVNAFSWIFYLFGVILIYTALRLVIGKASECEVIVDGPAIRENLGLRTLSRVLPTTGDYVGRRYIVRIGGRPKFTPLVTVTTAIGVANLVFALDSIPALFGLTRSGYIVFTANAFAMMGLRQLYFLINGLLKRIAYLSTGLAVILTFIGVKLIST